MSVIASKRSIDVIQQDLSKQLEVAQQAINKHLVPICGSEIAALPVYIDENASYPAYTTSLGIYLAGKVVRKDAANAHVYVMHEIGHHVIRNDELTLQYPAMMVNYAEDFWINYWMKDKWGFDVKAVKYKGIFNTKYGKMLPHQACKCLSIKYKGKNFGGCGSLGYSHPTIRRIANKLRKTFNVGNKYREGKLIACDATDIAVFDAYQNKLRALAAIHNLPVDLPNLVEGVFMRAFLEKPYVEKETRFLSTQQALAYCWDLQKIKSTSKGDPEKAALATVFYIQYISEFDRIIRNWILICEAVIKECNSKIKNTKIKKPEKRKAVLKLKRTETRLARLKKIEPLFDTLKKYPVERRYKKTNSTNALALHKPPSKREFLVSVYPNNSTKLLRLLSSMVARRYLNVSDLMDDFKKAFKDFVEMENEYERLKKEQEKKQREKEKQDGKLQDILKEFGNAVKDALNDKEGTPQNADSEPEDNRSGSGNAEKSAQGNSDLSSEDESNEENESDSEDDFNPDNVESLGSPSGRGGGQGSGSGKPVKTMFEIMSTLSDAQMRKLHHILMRMQEFETALSLRKSKSFDEYASTLDIIPAFGNEISRLHQNEVALLNNPNTQMLFYSKLADNGLSIHYPQNNKRNPVVILIDSSGSMHGNPYETATGFALAMLKKLADDKRGGALIIFSSSVVHKFVLKTNEELRLNEVIAALLQPQFGGTNFDIPLYQSYEIKKQENWKSMTTIMVTDGDCHITPTMYEYIKQQKSREDRLIAGLVKGSDHGFRGLNDETYHIDKNDMTNTLTKVGNSAL